MLYVSDQGLSRYVIVVFHLRLQSVTHQTVIFLFRSKMKGKYVVKSNNNEILKVLGDGVGSKFGAAALRTAAESVDIDKFLNNGVYGDIMTTDPRYLKEKKDKVSASMSLIITNVVWILQTVRKDSPTYVQTKARADVLGGWRELMKKHPHSWPKSQIFAYITDLRDILLQINLSTSGSLENDIAERFLQWEDQDRVLLPGGHKFIGIDLSTLYQRIRLLYINAAIIVSEFCTPPYGWRVAISTNSKKMTQSAGFGATGLQEVVRNWAHREIHKQYLAVLGVIDHKLDFTQLIPSFAQDATVGTARKIVEGMLAQRDLSSKVFGSEAVKDMADVLKELNSSTNHESTNHATAEDVAPFIGASTSYDASTSPSTSYDASTSYGASTNTSTSYGASTNTSTSYDASTNPSTSYDASTSTICEDAL